MCRLTGRLVSCALLLLAAITAANAEMKPLNPFGLRGRDRARCAFFGLQSQR
jgi:hypothetical protein